MMNSKNQDDRRQAIAQLCEVCLQSIIDKLKELTCSSSFDVVNCAAIKNHRENHHHLGNDEQNSVCLIEIRFWTQLKEFIGSQETVIINYIHGFYSYLLQVVTLLIDAACEEDIYFTQSRPLLKLLQGNFNDNNDEVKLLLYNINIRLGDLNRYLKNIKMARYYYHQARELNPLRGHAYNQLALVSTSELLTTLYYSTRALMAIEDPVKHAAATLDSLIKKCALINSNIDSFLSNRQEDFDPTKVINWIHLLVLAIYCDKYQAISYHIIRQSITLLETSLNRSSNLSSLPKDDKHVLPALDAMLDVFQSKINSDKLSNLELDAEFAHLISLLSLYNLHIDTKEVNLITTALRHDFTLYGLSFLKPYHDAIDFSQLLCEEQNTKLLLKRLSYKLDKLCKIICDKKNRLKAKKCRNIALQSILGSKATI